MMQYRGIWRFAILAFVYAMLVFLGISLADADMAIAGQPPRTILQIGSIASQQSYFIYVGRDAALFGNLHQSGWRARFVGGVGASRGNGVSPNAFVSSTRLTLGYQYVGTNTGASVLAGWQYEGRALDRPDPSDAKAGNHHGVTIEADAYWRPNASWLVSIWGQWSTVHRLRAMHLSVLRDVTSRLKAGIEASHYRDISARETKLGARLDVQLSARRTLSTSLGALWDRDGSGLYGGLQMRLAR